MKKKVHVSWLVVALSCMALCCMLSLSAFATEAKKKVAGKVYEFDKDSHYEIAEAGSDDAATAKTSNTYGSFFITGDIVKASTKDGVPAYEVELSNETFDLFYTYTDKLLTAEDGALQLIDDKSKEVNGKSLEDKIMKGAILLQTSKDRKSWTNIECWTNIFADEPTKIDALYSATDIQLNNGCFYRVIVAYETRIKTDPNKVLFVELDQYEDVKHAEVYEFYAYTRTAEENAVDLNQTYRLGSKIRVEKHDGYAGKAAIESDDIHSGWDVGNFYVSGYTSKTKDEKGNMVFLKNVGDKVTLWFDLTQNIDALNNDETLSITADSKGYDQEFEVGPTDFGRGTLIVRYTDYNENSTQEVYNNYLEANASVSANTTVQLCEEGDYEVALDYQVTKDQLIDLVRHYRISFKFSVRNGNCMVYPFDIKTGAELSNGAMIDNGFKLDLAKSRYLDIYVERKTLNSSADGLDPRFNRRAKDGEKYAEEGIYIIRAKNKYVDQPTIKIICVKGNSVLKAYFKNMEVDAQGNIVETKSIAEINALVEDGATILDDGTIQLAAKKNEVESSLSSPQKPRNSTNASTSIVTASVGTMGNISSSFICIVGVVAVLCLLAIAFIIASKRKRRETLSPDDDEVINGGTKQ